ncbi:unnamed protein product [Cunninghamella blakesleeana]
MSLEYTFLAHTVVEGIFAIQLLFFPYSISFLKIADDYARVIANGYGAALLGSAVTSVFAFGIPSILPCKRAAGIGFMVYHAIFAILAFQSRKEGPFTPIESWAMTILHTTFFALFYTWYRITGDQVQKYIKQNKEKPTSSH